jgi:ATP-binding cassette subfamily B protein
MRLLLSYIGKYKKILFGALVLAAINQLFSLLDPQIFRLIIDNYVSKFAELSGSEFARGVFLLILLSMGTAFISRVAKNFQDYYTNVITQRVGAQLYQHSVTHTFSLAYAVFEDQRSGELLQKLQKARADSQIFITSAISIVFQSVVGITFVLIYAFSVHWSIGLAYGLIIPILGGSTYTIGKKIKRAQLRIVKETAELAGSTTETIRNVELVKSLGLETQETDRLNLVNEQILGLELKKVKLIRTLSFIQGTLINAMRAGILFLMLWLIYSRMISLGQFFTLYFYSFFIIQPLGEFGNVASQYNEAKGSLEMLEQILSIPPEVKPLNPQVPGKIETISFKKVSFAYYPGAMDAVHDVSLSMRKGERVAFVGPSGSGKTTLLKLIVGLYKATGGSIHVNRIDSGDVDYDSFKKRIGYVSQETQLFAGTIRENLVFVNPNATDADCLAAIEAASATPIISRGGKGLDTKIGEGGIKISGGERQRLAIARALLRKPDIIIFDEATSSLDSITEKAITETIKEIASKQPELLVVMVAHRLSTILHADTIYVMRRGSVVEKGSHKELLKDTSGLYSALWREQSAGEA